MQQAGGEGPQRSEDSARRWQPGRAGGIPLEDLDEDALPAAGARSATSRAPSPDPATAGRLGYRRLLEVAPLEFARWEATYYTLRSSLLRGTGRRLSEHWGLQFLRAEALQLTVRAAPRTEPTPAADLRHGLKVLALLWGALLDDLAGEGDREQALPALAALRQLLSGQQPANLDGLPRPLLQLVRFGDALWVRLWELLRALFPAGLARHEEALLGALSLVFEAHECHLAIRRSPTLLSDLLAVNVLAHRGQILVMGLIDLLALPPSCGPNDQGGVVHQALWGGQRLVTLADELAELPHRMARGELVCEATAIALALGLITAPGLLRSGVRGTEALERIAVELRRRQQDHAAALAGLAAASPVLDLAEYARRALHPMPLS